MMAMAWAIMANFVRGCLDRGCCFLRSLMAKVTGIFRSWRSAARWTAGLAALLRLCLRNHSLHLLGAGLARLPRLAWHARRCRFLIAQKL